MAFSATRVTVTNAATEIVRAVGHMNVTIRNRGTASVMVGSSANTASNGFELESGASVGLQLWPGEVIYGITAATSERVDVAKSGQTS